MADALKLRVPLSKHVNTGGTTVAFSTFVIDGTTDECAWIFQVEKAITITQVGFRVSTITGTPGELTVSLNTVDGATGFPSATIVGGGSPASVAIASPAASFTAGQVYWATLTNSHAAVAGEILSIKLDPTAGTWDASNSVTVTMTFTMWADRVGTPYAVTAPSGTYAKSANYPVYGIRGTSDTHGCPIETFTSVTLDSGTNPNQVGAVFTLPAAWGSTYAVRGFYVLLARPNSANQTFDIVLYDSDGITELQVMNYDSEIIGTTSGSGTRLCEFYFDESTLSTLSFGTKYYIFIRPLTTSGDIVIPYFSVRQSSDMQAFPLGENCFAATKVNTATTPVETATNRLYAGLILDDITEPSGGGGLAANPIAGFIS